MAKIYYPKSSLILSRPFTNQAGISMVETVVSGDPTDIVVFDSGSFNTNTITTASYAPTASYSMNGEGKLETGSYQQITASYAYMSIVSGNGNGAARTWGASSFVQPTAPWTTVSAISRSLVDAVPTVNWDQTAERPFLIPDPVYIPLSATHVRITFIVKNMVPGGTSSSSGRFCLKMRTIKQSGFEPWSGETVINKFLYLDYVTFWNFPSTTNTLTLEFPLSELNVSAGDFVKFWFARDVSDKHDASMAYSVGVQSVTIEPFTARPIPSGSLKETLISKSIDMINGRPYETYKNRFSTRDDGTPNYVLSGSRLDDVVGFNPTGFPVWNSTRGTQYTGFLVSPRHMICANISVGINAGAVIRFVDITGSLVTRSVSTASDLPNQYGVYPNIRVLTLNSDLPSSSIMWYKVAPPNLEDYVINHGKGVPIWTYWGNTDSYLCSEIDRNFRNNYPNYPATIGICDPVENSASLSSWHANSAVSQLTGPIFFVMPNNEVIINAIGIWVTSNVFDIGGVKLSSPTIFTGINNIMSSQSYQLVTASFDDYPILKDLGYKT